MVFGVLVPALSDVASAQTTVDFGVSPVGPITNIVGESGEFSGTEYASLGLWFHEDPGHHLNIGCATVTGSPANCLGADRTAVDDFEGTVTATFALGDESQVTDSIVIEYVNTAPPGTRTIIRGAFGDVLLDQPAGNVNFSAPGIASVEMQFTYDGADTFTFGPLSPSPGHSRGQASGLSANLVRSHRERLWIAGRRWYVVHIETSVPQTPRSAVPAADPVVRGEGRRSAAPDGARCRPVQLRPRASGGPPASRGRVPPG